MCAGTEGRVLHGLILSWCREFHSDSNVLVTRGQAWGAQGMLVKSHTISVGMKDFKGPVLQHVHY